MDPDVVSDEEWMERQPSGAVLGVAFILFIVYGLVALTVYMVMA